MKKGWETTQLSAVAAVQSGAGFPDRYQGQSDGEIPFYKVSDMNIAGNEREMVLENNSITEEARRELGAFLFPQGSTIFPKIGGAIATNKKRLTTRDCCVDNNVMGVIPKPEKINSEFLYYFFLAHDLSEFANEAHLPSIRKTVVEDWPISLPVSLAEQRRIVAILDEAFEEIAVAKANAEKNLQNARTLFESGLDSAITGKLTLEWRHKHTKTGSASADLAGRLAVRRKQWTGPGKYREPDAPVTLKPIDIPDGWVLASPEQITTHIVDCPHSTPKWAESGVLCLRTTNFKPGFLDLESVRFVSPQTYKERIMRLEPQAGDVLYSREGGILGIACMIPAKLKTCLGQRMMLFRTDVALVLPEYFTAVLNSTLILSEVKRLTGGAASPHLNICDIRTFPIPLPPITEQQKIVAKLNTIAAETQRLARLYERKLAALDDLKKSVLHEAFEGNLTAD